MSNQSGPIDPALPERCHPYYRKRYRRRRKNRAAYLGADHWYQQGDTFQIGPFEVKPATPGATGPTSFTLRESNRLWRHEREKDARYSRRLRMAVYENNFGPQINTVAGTIAKACRGVTWAPGLEYLDSNADRWGCDWATQRNRRIAWALVQAEAYTLLEKPEYIPPADMPPDTGPASRAHELAAGIRVYAQELDVLDLLDWEWDAEAMEFRWALIRVSMPAQRSAPDEPGIEEQTGTWTKLYKRAETPDGPGLWILYYDGNEVRRGNGPSFVPICVQFAVGKDPREAEPVGIPINDDAADLAERRFNKGSWLTDQESGQCFNQMWIKQSNPIDAETEQQIGTWTYIAADAMGWVAPNVAPMEHLINSMERDSGEMRRMLGIETKGETSQAAKSGVALQLESQNVSSLFAMFAAAAEAGERAICRMAARLEGVDPDACDVLYVKDFSALDAQARFGTLMSALGLQGGFTGTAKAELLKQVFLAAHPDIEPEKREAIFLEIDAEAVRAKAASEAQRVQAQAVMDRLASGKPAEEPEDDEDDDAGGKGKVPPFATKGSDDDA